jgi:hypothetical protein
MERNAAADHPSYAGGAAGVSRAARLQRRTNVAAAAARGNVRAAAGFAGLPPPA